MVRGQETQRVHRGVEIAGRYDWKSNNTLKSLPAVDRIRTKLQTSDMQRYFAKQIEQTNLCD